MCILMVGITSSVSFYIIQFASLPLAYYPIVDQYSAATEKENVSMQYSFQLTVGVQWMLILDT